MKTFISTSYLVFLVISSYCQPDLDFNGGNARFQKVIDVPGKATSDLYKIATRWVALTFTNPDKATNSAIENEMIRGGGYQGGAVKLAAIAYGDMKYEWQIDVKEGRVRFIMSNMKVATSSQGTYSFESYVFKNDGTERSSSQAQNVKESFAKQANTLLLSLQNSLLHPDKKEDW